MRLTLGQNLYKCPATNVLENYVKIHALEREVSSTKSEHAHGHRAQACQSMKQFLAKDEQRSTSYYDFPPFRHASRRVHSLMLIKSWVAVVSSMYIMHNVSIPSPSSPRTLSCRSRTCLISCYIHTRLPTALDRSECASWCIHDECYLSSSSCIMQGSTSDTLYNVLAATTTLMQPPQADTHTHEHSTTRRIYTTFRIGRDSDP